MGLKLLCISYCSRAGLSNRTSSFSFSSPSSFVFISFSLPLFFGPFITPVSVRVEALGHVSSFS